MSFIVTAQQQAIDLAMVPYDIWGTRAHVIMLNSIGVITQAELDAILKALHQIEEEHRAGKYQIDPALGAQMTLEKSISDIAGKEIGGKVHTGRSRNDQIVTAQRLFTRDQLFDVQQQIVDLIRAVLELSEQHIKTVMPGYTHMQPAKPTTVGQWCAAYAEMFLRDLERLIQTGERYDVSPLGAAESYGTSWKLDRALTAKLLGFREVQPIPLDVVASRGEMETEILSDLAFLNLHLSKIAQDLLLLSTYEFGMVELGTAVAQRMGKVTGSSIMPQKKNPDVLELLRANASIVYGQLFQAFEVLKGLPFGYNRDSRETKELILTGIDRSLSGVTELRKVLETLHFRADKMEQAVRENFSMATDLADYLAQNHGLPYRMAYTVSGKTVNYAIEHEQRLDEVDVAVIQQIAREEFEYNLNLSADELRDILDPVKALARRTHIGGAAEQPMREWLAMRSAQLEQIQVQIDERWARVEQARKLALNYVVDTARG